VPAEAQKLLVPISFVSEEHNFFILANKYSQNLKIRPTLDATFLVNITSIKVQSHWLLNLMLDFIKLNWCFMKDRLKFF
jgi:hypothetical protein